MAGYKKDLNVKFTGAYLDVTGDDSWKYAKTYQFRVMSPILEGEVQLENGLYADVYSLEIIIPVAFRLNTYYTHVFRMWLVEKALSKEKRQAYVMFIQNGKTGYC